MIAQWKQWEKEGVSRREMERRTGVSLRRIALVLGPRQMHMQPGNRRPEHVVYVHDGPWREAAEVARKLGYRVEVGERTGQGSVGALIEAIGTHKVAVVDLNKHLELLDLARKQRGDARRVAAGVA
jgi:hypothetical protein